MKLNTKYKKYSKLINDIINNSLSSILQISITQLIILPLISKNAGEHEFGKILTIVAIINFCSVVFGNSLNNTRVILNKEIGENELGNYNHILIKNLIYSVIIISISLYIINQNIINSILIILYSCMNIVRTYSYYEYRVKLQFRKILISNIYLSIGYLIGLGLFLIIKKVWIVSFLFGEIISFIFLLKNNSLFVEKVVKTKMYDRIDALNIQFKISAFVTNIINYLDRIMIYPLIGAENVSVLYISSVFSKNAAIVFTPLANVLLSHLSQISKQKAKKYFKLSVIISLISTISVLCISMVITPIFIRILYKNMYEKAIKLVLYTNLISSINIGNSIIKPFIIRVSNMKKFNIINIIYLAIYTIFTVFGVIKYGLIGFCIGAIVANIINYINNILFGYYSIKDNIIRD